MHESRIEWTESTWNPVTGCTKVSSECLNCYAERMARRLQAMGQTNYVNEFEATCHPGVRELPLKWKKSQTVSVNSMSDLYHEQVPFAFIECAHTLKFSACKSMGRQLCELRSRSDSNLSNHHFFEVRNLSDSILIACPLGDFQGNTRWLSELGEGGLPMLLGGLMEFQLSLGLAGHFLRGGWTVHYLYSDKDHLIGPAMPEAEPLCGVGRKSPILAERAAISYRSPAESFRTRKNRE